MPFRLPFYFPPFYNNYRNPYLKSSNSYTTPHFNNINFNQKSTVKNNNPYSSKKEDSEVNESSESFFEVLGLKLYFDDILIICLLFILYTEKVQDEELFICLILLLLA